MSPRQRRGTTRRSTCSDTTDHAARGPRARNPRTEVECGDPPKFRMTRADLRLGSWHVIPKLMARAVAQSAEDFLPKETIEKFPY